jgi:hypothetical protein
MRDKETGNENLDLGLNRFKRSQKIRFYNNPNPPHCMQHSIHLHIHFLSIIDIGKRNDNLI